MPTAWECGRVGGARRAGARVRVHRRARRPDRRGRRQRGRRARAARHDAHREPRSRRSHEPVAGLLGDPAHRAGHVPGRRPEQRGRAVRELGDRARCATSSPASSSIPVGSRCGRRTRAASGCRCTIPTGAACWPISTSPTTRRRCGAPRSRRPGFVARRTIDAASAAHGVDPAPDRRDRRRDPRSTSGCRRSPTAPGSRSSAPRCPRAPRSARPSWPAAPLGSGGRRDDRPRPAGRRPGRTVDPDPAWVEPAGDRYQRFLELSA